MRRLEPTIPIAMMQAPRSQTQKKGRKVAISILSRRDMILIYVITALLVVASLVWLIFSGTSASLWSQGKESLVTLSANIGFKLDEIMVTGRDRTPRDELLKALAIQRGSPTLALDLNELKQKVEGISWIRSATIERRLPNEIHLVITERNPVALWQKQGTYYLVDGDGQVVGSNIDNFHNLPLIVGSGAPNHVETLTSMLSSEPDLRSRYEAAQWVGNRRWNIVLKGGKNTVEVRLPEENPEQAWHDLAAIEKRDGLLERKITIVDMRLQDRIVVRSEGISLGTDLPARKH